MHFVFWQTTFQSSNRQTKSHSSLILVACLEAKAGWPQGTQTSHPHCYTVSKRFPGEGGKQHSCVVQSSGLTLMQKEKNTYQKILTEVVKSAAAISGHRWSDAGGCPSWGTHSLAFSFIPESQPGTCLVSVLGVQLGSSIQPRPACS